MREIVLSKPISAHAEEVTTLTLRAPTGKDLRSCGVPYKLTSDAEMTIEAAGMHRMISALAGIPPSAVDQLAAGDWNACAMAVLDFITPAQATTTSS